MAKTKIRNSQVERKDELLKLAQEAQINVGLLECCSKERYEALGRTIIQVLMRSESKRLMGVQDLTVQEVIVHGS